MQPTQQIEVRRLRIAATRIRSQWRTTGIDRAIFIAARNYRRDDKAGQPVDTVRLGTDIVERIQELTPELTQDEQTASVD